MKTNHQRGFKANDDAPRPDANWSTRMYRKLQSGKQARVKAWHTIIHNGNRGISKTLSEQKKDIRRQERRDARVVVDQQLEDLESDELS